MSSETSLSADATSLRSPGRLTDGRRGETVKVRLDSDELSRITRAAAAANGTPARFLRDAALARATGNASSDSFGQVVLLLNALFLQSQNEGVRICPKLTRRAAEQFRRVTRHLESRSR